MLCAVPFMFQVPLLITPPAFCVKTPATLMVALLPMVNPPALCCVKVRIAGTVNVPLITLVCFAALVVSWTVSETLLEVPKAKAEPSSMKSSSPAVDAAVVDRAHDVAAQSKRTRTAREGQLAIGLDFSRKSGGACCVEADGTAGTALVGRNVDGLRDGDAVGGLQHHIVGL